MVMFVIDILCSSYRETLINLFSTTVFTCLQSARIIFCSSVKVDKTFKHTVFLSYLYTQVSEAIQMPH